MPAILAITCPSGKQCAHLIARLRQDGAPFTLRLGAHSQKSVETLRARYPDAEVVQVDLTSLPACQTLLHGATSVFHVGPSLHSREKEMGFNMVDAAVAESRRPGNVFRHFVFSSVLGTQHRNLMQHDLKSYVEERLFLSPLNWTVLKPTNFMDAYPVAVLAAQEHPVIERLWTPDIPNSLIALRDLGDAAAKVLVEGETHYLAEYPLCSTMPQSDRAVVEAIGRRIGKAIEIRSPSYETGVSKLLTYLFSASTATSAEVANLYADASSSASVPAPASSGPVHSDWAFNPLAAEGDLRGDLARDAAERLILFYTRRGLRGSPNVLRWLLGRPPTTVEEWIESQMAAK